VFVNTQTHIRAHEQDKIKEALQYGVVKMNIDTDIQVSLSLSLSILSLSLCGWVWVCISLWVGG
jgi:hypothetical protein